MPPTDLTFLERAFSLAEKGRYSVSPNPMVGAVVVRDGRVVGEGHHRRAGEPHAEILALREAGKRAHGADLYLTLEPCAHQGRTPPCAPALIAAGLRRVVVASSDPNPLVAGRGIAALRRAGVEVIRAPRSWREREAAQNAKFRTWIASGRPLVLAKWASTLDGRIASAAGKSRWLTGERARRRALALREEYDAVLVGAGTVIAEDARVFRGPGRALVVTAVSARHPKARRLASRGVVVWSLPSRTRGRVDLRRLLRELARRDVASLIVEGGAETLGSFFSAGLVDRVAVFLAPRILGGARAPAAVGGLGFALGRTPRLDQIRIGTVGDDLLVTGRVT